MLVLWFWVKKTDYVGVSRLRSSIFFLAFVLFFDFDFAKLGGPKKDSRLFRNLFFPKLIPRTQLICSQPLQVLYL
jgi:hypothetical protein